MHMNEVHVTFRDRQNPNHDIKCVTNFALFMVRILKSMMDLPS